MFKKLQITFLLSVFLTCGALAQSGTVTGVVTDASNGEPLIGTTVQLVELNRGDATDIDGRYEISNIPAGTYTLQVTYVGFATYETEVEVGSGTVTVDVQLEEDVLAFDDVVVTALGMETNERAVTFATQKIDAQELNITQSSNIKTGLAGKVAGVQMVGQAGSKLGEFGEIRIRGAISLTSAMSEPLYVVDGVPVPDPNMIDMNNVADINVLKGPNATSLYGQRGESGVVLISTKTANRSGVSVEFTNAVTWDQVAYLPNYQNEYGQGYAGEGEWTTFNYDPTVHPDYFAPLDGTRYIGGTDADASWGPRFDGDPYTPWYAWWPGTEYHGKTVPYESSPNTVKNFFDTGVTGKTSLALNVNGSTYAGRISYSNLSQNGILPFSNLNKHYLNGNFEFDITDKFRMGAVVNYTTQEVNGDVLSDGYGNQTTGQFNSWYGRNIDTEKMRELKDLTTPDGYYTSWNWFGPERYSNDGVNNANNNVYKKPTFWFNPYTWMEKYDIIRNTNDLLLNVDLSYALTNELELTGAANTTTRNYSREYYIPYEIEYSSGHEAYQYWVNSFGLLKDEDQETNFSGALNYKTNFDDWNIDALAGGNVRMENFNRFSSDMDQQNYQSGGLIIPDVFQFSNSAERLTPTAYDWEKKVYSLYARASVGFQDFIYIDGSYRQDWSSALPSDNNGYGYPGIGVSFVFSELLENDALSYGKLRAGWAQVGNDVDAEAIISSFALSSNAYTNPITGQSLPLLFTDNTFIDPNIQPAINSSFEVGFDLRFVDDRIGLSATYYDEVRENEIIGFSLSQTTGASNFLTNAGVSERSGIELTLTGAPVQTRDFLWDITVNWATNETIVTELPADLPSYEVSLATSNAFGFVSVTHVEGEEWGQLRGAGFARDDNGEYILTSNGLYTVEQNQNFGSVLPDWTGGVLNTFSYKGLNLTAAIDFQKGGKFFSLSEMWGTYTGLLEETAGLNDLGNPQRDPVSEGGGVHVTGVDASGNPVDRYVPADVYYGQWYANRLAEPFVHDASYVKLREVALSYNLPQRWIGDFVNSASVGIVGRNLWLIAVSDDNKHGWDPSEMAERFGENGQLPGTRSFGFNVSVNF